MQVIADRNAAVGYVGSHSNHGHTPSERISLQVTVDPSSLRARLGDGFDRVEHVYGRVPRYEAGGVKYEKVEVPFHTNRTGADEYACFLPETADVRAIRQEGVSFFLETKGHVELQNWGDNVFPRGAFGPY
ncbi:MAG: hypothetical protein IPK13_02480 [Deltaproteobacteria bacterium]|nr:hypothetical protein [Deltaproteobacteria bacterium]